MIFMDNDMAGYFIINGQMWDEETDDDQERNSEEKIKGRKSAGKAFGLWDEDEDRD